MKLLVALVFIAIFPIVMGNNQNPAAKNCLDELTQNASYEKLSITELDLLMIINKKAAGIELDEREKETLKIVYEILNQ